MKTVKLRFTNETAKTQYVSIPAVQATALTFMETYLVSGDLAAILLRQGGWEPVVEVKAAKTAQAGQAAQDAAIEKEGE